MQVNVLEAKNTLSQLIRSAQAGEEVVIANRGQPVARLVPISPVEAHAPKQEKPRDFVAWLKANPLPRICSAATKTLRPGFKQSVRPGIDLRRCLSADLCARA